MTCDAAADALSLIVVWICSLLFNTYTVTSSRLASNCRSHPPCFSVSTLRASAFPPVVFSSYASRIRARWHSTPITTQLGIPETISATAVSSCAFPMSRSQQSLIRTDTYNSSYTYNGPASKPQHPPQSQQDLDNKLLEAIETGQLHRIKHLLKKGADPNSRDSSNNGGQHALCVAAGYGHLGIVKILLHEGADVDNHDRQKRTALHTAARHGNDEIVTMLVLAGAEVDARDQRDETPLTMASFGKHLSTVKLLHAAGATFRGHNDLCEHKLLTLCSLSSTGQCCACYDTRPKVAMYPKYVDGLGSVLQGTRSQHYCCNCKQWREENRSGVLSIIHGFIG